MMGAGILPEIRKILVANRSEIAIRVFRAANELGHEDGRAFSEEDKLALHRFKADEAYQIGRGPHLERRSGRSRRICRSPKSCASRARSGADAIHPGYGLLSESPEFAEACAAAGITFIGPSPETMRKLGNKVAARDLAVAAGVPVMPATDPLPDDPEAWQAAGRDDRLPADAEGLVGRRRARHARHPRRGGADPRRDRGASARPRPPSARTRSISKSWSSAPATSRCRSSATRTAIASISSSATARSSAATRRSSSARRRPTSTQAQREELCGYALTIADGRELCLRRHGRVPAGRRRPANSTSSRSIRASRSSTPSPRR